MRVNVLSLFDGMSCGQIALERAGIKVDNYYASEIKPHAVDVTINNYPLTKQLGDVTKWREWDIDWSSIDLVIGGSPCQDLSGANSVRDGLKGLKSRLFYTFIDILNHVRSNNPNVKFLLENVKMTKDNQDIISMFLDVEPILINSSLVSAQMRKRNYWTNIEGVTQPEDKGILFKDILDPGGYTNKEKAFCILESESRPQTCNWKRFRRWRKKSFVNIVFEDETLNLFHNRILSQTELEKLQTVPVGYTSILNRNDAACLLGDGWTVDVICHIFKNIKN